MIMKSEGMIVRSLRLFLLLLQLVAAAQFSNTREEAIDINKSVDEVISRNKNNCNDTNSSISRRQLSSQYDQLQQSEKKEKKSKNKKKKTCLLVSIDNRQLSETVNDANYAPKTAVLNLEYATYHGYDFLYVQNIVQDFEALTRARFKSSDGVDIEDKVPQHMAAAKDVATAFHVGLRQFRAASWAKLPALWHVTTTVGMDYEYIWYIDSDAAINPMNRDHGIEATLEEFEKSEYFIRGNPRITNSDFVFFHNHPWRDNMPCAGSFIYKPRPESEAALREWWDYNMPSKNFYHFHEQDALWHMIEAEDDADWKKQQQQRGQRPYFLINSSTYSVLKERQFPSQWQRYEQLWLCHIASYNFQLRLPILFHFLNILGLDVQHRFAAKIQQIQQQHSLRINLLDVGIAMEAASVAADTTASAATAAAATAAAKRLSSSSSSSSSSSHSNVVLLPRISQFPPHDARSQQQWYDAHVTSKQQSPLPPQLLHEGRLIRRRGEFWVVNNGSKRGFESYDTFLKLGFYNELGFALDSSEVDQIPTGSTITATEATTGGIASISRNYRPLPRGNKHQQQQHEQFDGGAVVAVTAAESSLIQQRMQRRQQLAAAAAAGHNNSHSGSSHSGTSHSGSSHSHRHASCQAVAAERTLNALVHRNGTRSLLYLIAHDSSSERLAQQFSQCRESWVQPVVINSTVFFESVLYRDLLLPFQREWQQYDFVVTATYKTVAKQLHYNGFTQSLQQIEQLLQVAAGGDYDIVPFLRSGSGTMSFCLYFHGTPFRRAWDALLTELGYPLPFIRSLDEMKSFYRNIYIIKTSVLKELTAFMNRAIHVASFNPLVRQLLSVDSGYKEGSKEVAQRIFGTDYYQLHPFIFERLPSFFLHAKEAKICSFKEGPCAWNS